MFEVRVMCEDSKLHKVLWALDGLIVGMPQMLPVRNAVASKDKTKVKEKYPHGGGVMMKLWHELQKGWPGTPFTWEEAAEIITPINGSRTSTSSYLNRLVKAGKISRVAKGKYKIN